MSDKSLFQVQPPVTQSASSSERFIASAVVSDRTRTLNGYDGVISIPPIETSIPSGDAVTWRFNPIDVPDYSSSSSKGYVGTKSDGTLRGSHSNAGYDFYGSMPESVLHNYLDRSIDMHGLSSYRNNQVLAATGLQTSAADHDAEIDMLLRIGAKYISGMVSFWEPWANPTSLTINLNQFRLDVNRIHSVDSDVICEGMVWEHVGMEVSDSYIPAYVFIDFGLTPENRPFDYFKIIYTDPALSCGEFPKVDISRLEAQFWYYYMATRMIDNGAEAIHFGDIFLINCVDKHSGNANLWKVVSLVRDYAAGRSISNTSRIPKARRGLVLCSGTYYPTGENNVYFDPNTAILPDWQRQLIFDIELLNYRQIIKRASYPPCTESFQPIIFDLSSSYWWGATPPGLHPQGWFCAHTPCVLANDNAGVHPRSGCSVPSPDEDWNSFWGFDASSWFLAQSSTWKNRIIPYLYYGIKCHNPYMHYHMPGRLFSNALTRFGPVSSLYTANDFHQDAVIANTWNNTPPIPPTPVRWLYHDFMMENTVQFVVRPASSLIFVGGDKIYYIGEDRYIHGFIKVSDYNNGTWLSVSPSYAAHYATDQFKAKSDLVASPDGTRLIYIGLDGYIYGFNIINVWTYSPIWEYIPPSGGHGAIHPGFLSDEMRHQNIVAVGSLIYPTNESIYYVGKWSGDGSEFIHGFQKASGSWVTVSPSYSAASPSAIHPISVSAQGQAASNNALAYEPNTRRLYYKTAYGFLAYFLVSYDLVNYAYVSHPASGWMAGSGTQIQGNLAVYHNVLTGQSRLYYIGQSYSLNKVYCIVDNVGSSWSNIEVSRPGLEASSSGYVAVSPDGNTIAYIGSSAVVSYCQLSATGSYFCAETAPANFTARANNSLQFTSNSDIYYINLMNPGIRRFKFQPAFCENTAVTNFP